MPQPQQQRQSPRVPLHLRTATSDSHGASAHHRRVSPKPEGNLRRSPRTPLQELPTSATNQKKRGTTRVSNLETKLGHAKEELRKLKEQLASAEAAKRDAQHELQETKKMMPSSEAAAGGKQPEEEQRSSTETEGSAQQDQEVDDQQKQPVDAPPVEDGSIQAASFEAYAEEGGDETHVALVLAEKMPEEEEKERSKEEEPKEPSPATPEVMTEKMLEEEKNEGIKEEEPKEPSPATPPAESEAAQVTVPEENKRTDTDKPKLQENAEVVERCLAENAGLKKQLAEAEEEAAAALVREAEMALRLSLAGEELAEAKSTADQIREQLEAAEAAKASLETEMRTMRVQTEQWRKAAEAAAAVLSGSTAEARVSVAAAERRGSTDEYMGGVGYEGSGMGFSGLWSPLASVEPEEGLGVGRRKGGVGGGIRVFGDLWRKRGQQQQHHQRI
ncbi:hypothetical protein Taro_007798 [Colocasia esculenta]|uniref:Interactor of constitutive active ROPs 4 n=1 Tax=Colocasia esculenta TaxID=4460 RepID=A0A843TZ89_COLES|nr:hypothetical protein [Colocasia esculenta]